MTKLPFCPFLMIPLVAAACNDGPATITISTVREPAAIAFRDGLAGTWQVPAPIATGSYEIEVNGPYMVSVVCSALDGFLINTRQIARTPDDSRELDLECLDYPMSTVDITGTVVQPGVINFADLYAGSETPSWDLIMSSPTGTFDLIGVSANRILLRRDLEVTSGGLNLSTIDIDANGVPLVPAALTVPNAATGEGFYAVVTLSTPGSKRASVHDGSLASTKIAPTSLLSADVRQTAEVFAWQDDSSRSVRRDFRADDPTAFTLPEPLGALQFETTGGNFIATWSTLPEHDKLVVTVNGEDTSRNNARGHELELSKSFMDAAGGTSATLDTDFPGYQPAWRIDFGGEYLRQVQAVRERDGERASSEHAKLMNREPPMPGQLARPRALPQAALAKLRLAR